MCNETSTKGQGQLKEAKKNYDECVNGHRKALDDDNDNDDYYYYDYVTLDALASDRNINVAAYKTVVTRQPIGHALHRLPRLLFSHTSTKLTLSRWPQKKCAAFPL